jgi:glycine oxidase
MVELPRTTAVAIIGGGVIGLAVARALALRGVRDLLVVERGRFGAESSSAAAGMLAPQAEADAADEFFQLCRRSRDLYPLFAAKLLSETGIDVQLETAGTLYLALNEEDVEELSRRYNWQSAAGLAVERLSAAGARKLEPAISESVRMALRFPFDTQVENRLLLKALVASTQNHGVKLAADTSVTSLKLVHGRIAGLETSEGFVATEKVVVAAGAWSSLLSVASDESEMSPDSALPVLGIEPVRGQMLCFDTESAVFNHVIYSPRGYIVPRRDGRLLAGSTTEHVGFDKRVSDAGRQSIHRSALEISPAIEFLPLKESWAGLRPRTADGLPAIGACAEIEGLFYATGHYRNGILLAPLTGDRIAEELVDGVASSTSRVFSPNRFARVCVG